MAHVVRNNRARQGMTLTEVALVMLIIGVVLTALWVAVEAVYTNSRIATTSKQILEIVSKTRSLYGLSRSSAIEMTIAGTAGATTMAQIGIVPKDMADFSVTPLKVVHAWRGDVTIDAERTNTDGDSFTIGLVDVPSSVCAGLIVRMSGVTRDEGLIAVGTTASSQTRAEMPVSLSTAVGDCVAEKNKVIFTFMLKT